MEVHCLEWQLPCKPNRHHHHAGDPKEENVMPCLQQRRGEESLHIGCLIRPPHHREGKEARGKPRVKHVLVLFKLDRLHPQLFLGLVLCILERVACEPDLFLLNWLHYFVGWDAMTPPELARNTPLLNILQPMEPSMVVELRKDL